jgi:MipA family protein
MKKSNAIFGGIFVFMAFLLIPDDAILANEEKLPLVPLPSVFDFTRGSGWGVALGIGVEYEAAYDGSDEYEFEFDPAGAIQWRKDHHLFFWEGMELGWKSRLQNLWLTQLGVRYESGLEPDDSEDGHLDGLEERDSHIVGFAELRRSLDPNWQNWIGGRIMAGEAGFGVLCVIAAGHRFGSRLDGTGTEVFLFSTFGTSEFINKDFGVTQADSAASGLPAIDLNGGYRSTGLTVIDRRYLTDHIHIISEAGIELYADDIQDSPIARKDFEAEIGLSLVYHF